MDKELKLYVWDNVLTDYTDGVAFALAYDVEEAVRVCIEYYMLDMHRDDNTPQVVEKYTKWVLRTYDKTNDPTAEELDEEHDDDRVPVIVTDLQYSPPRIHTEPIGHMIWGGG